MSFATTLFAASRPRSPAFLALAGPAGQHLFLPDGSRLYDIDGDTAAALEAAAAEGTEAALLAAMGLLGRPRIDDAAPPDPPVRALSLAIAQKCNLGCTYCYAQQGDFGATPRAMPPEVALQAVELLFSEASPGERVSLSFLGGEPLAARAALRATTERAEALAAERGVRLALSLTTNGTLLRPDDAEFFEAHGFAVTVSVDGLGEVHDRTRPLKGGGSSWDRLRRGVEPLLARQRRMQVSARVTVTPENLALEETLDGLVRMGFFGVGFSPLLRSSSGEGELDAASLSHMLDQMVACGRRTELALVAGERYPFQNLLTALKELHAGTHRPYPCGAGAGYLGVSADGALSACHRFVGDEAGALGSLATGVDRTRQRAWLEDRHVHRQEPCRSCWARYLCGGGCHHEVIARGRPACDYIRGWLLYCMHAYLRLSTVVPALFEA